MCVYSIVMASKQAMISMIILQRSETICGHFIVISSPVLHYNYSPHKPYTTSHKYSMPSLCFASSLQMVNRDIQALHSAP